MGKDKITYQKLNKLIKYLKINGIKRLYLQWINS
jgi:hypothetical protein